jgi:TatD DNase family protein
MLIDTHAHVNFSAFKDDGDEVIKRALAAETWLVNVGSQYDTSRRAAEYARKYGEGVWAAVALHPIHLKGRKIVAEVDPEELIEFQTKEERFDMQKYRELAQEPKVVAIGETGLDYYHLDPGHETEQKVLQKESFLAHLKLARELGKPVIIHCREAHQELLEILKAQISDGQNKFQGVVHSFSGRLSQAEQYLALGFYLSFNGLVTFARDYDKVILNMPLERLLLETDCPYLTPVPFRGKRNEPLYVKYVADKISDLRGISFEELAAVTTANARKLFRI